MVILWLVYLSVTDIQII